MNVLVTLVGVTNREKQIIWPEGWPIPREGEDVETKEHGLLSVRTVVWYPEGDDSNTTPFVYLVIGPRRSNDR